LVARSGTGIIVGNTGGSGNILTGDSGTPPLAGGTIVADGGTTIVVNGQPKSVQLTATAGGSPITGTWTTSDPTIGTVGSDGVFHANGFVGGTVDVILLVGKAQVKITLTVNVDITENPANLPTADQTALKAGGAVDPNFKFLYPFDGTVFPRGLPAPVLQFGDGRTVAGTANGTYVSITTNHFSYQQFGVGGTPVRVVIPEPVWRGGTITAGSNELAVAVTKRTGTTISGPVTEKWRIAPASLKGFIYYSTYKSPLLPNDPATNIGGGILRIRPLPADRRGAASSVTRRARPDVAFGRFRPGSEQPHVERRGESHCRLADTDQAQPRRSGATICFLGLDAGRRPGAHERQPCAGAARLAARVRGHVPIDFGEYGHGSGGQLAIARAARQGRPNAGVFTGRQAPGLYQRRYGAWLPPTVRDGLRRHVRLLESPSATERNGDDDQRPQCLRRMVTGPRSARPTDRLSSPRSGKAEDHRLAVLHTGRQRPHLPSG
jgi:hypothetical protein